MALPILGMALVVAPAHAAVTATPDSGVVLADGVATFSVLANDTGTDDTDTLTIDSGPDTSGVWIFPDIDGAGLAAIDVDPSSAPSNIAPGVYDIGYTIHDSSDVVVGSSTLHVAIVPHDARMEAGDGHATVVWPGLPSGITGLHVSHAVGDLSAHNGTEVTSPGTGNVDVPGLDDDVSYAFYVTPFLNGVDLQNGVELFASPRATNTPPVANDDFVSLTAANPEPLVQPTRNDTDQDGDFLSIISHTATAHGTLSCTAFGCTYVPSDESNLVADSATYTVSDGYSGTATATLHFVPRSGVTAASDSASTFVDESTDAHPLANDTGVINSDTVQLNSVPSSVDASVGQDGRTVHITGVTAGDVPVPYSVVDDQGETVASSSIAVHVGPKRPLVANDDTSQTDLDLAADVKVGQNDYFSANSFPLDTTNTKVLTGPTHGTATLSVSPEVYEGPNDALDGQTLNLPVVHYTPGHNYLGDDTFTYQVKDAQGNVDSATVTVHVGIPQMTFVDAGPGVSQSAVQWGFSSSPAVNQVEMCYAVGSDRATTPDTPTRACGAANDHLVSLPSGLPTSFTLPNLTNDRWHTVAVWIHSDDGTANGVWSDPGVSVVRPGVGSVSNVYTDAGGGGKIGLTWTNPAGNRAATGTTIRYSTTADPTTPTDGAGGTTAASGATSATLTGLTDGTTYHVSVFATNTSASSFGDPVTQLVTVKNTNAPPVANTDPLTLNENTFGSVQPLANDTDANSDPLDLKSYTQPAHGSVSCQREPFVTGDPWVCDYGPNSNYSGPDSFTYVVGDHHFGTATGTVNITVNQVNTAPQAFDDSRTATTGHATSIDLTQDAFDIDNNTLTYAVVTQSAHGTLNCTSAGACTYTATGGYTGSDSFTWHVTDNGTTGGVPDHKTSQNATMDLQVVTDQAPRVQDQTASVHPGQHVTINVAQGAIDPDNDTLTYSVSSPPAKGTVTCTGAGSCTYTAGASSTGQDSFQFQAGDGHGMTATGTVVVSLTNHPPVANDTTFTTDNATPYVANLANLSSDADGDQLTFSKVSGPTPAAAGAVACTGSSCTYTPASGYTGAVSFVYQASDGLGGTDNGTISGTVTASGVNHPPVAGADTLATTANKAATVNVALNDSDPDGDSLTFAKATDGQHGTVACTAAGSCTYTPASNYVGTDSFTYTVGDGNGGTATGTVNVTVKAVQIVFTAGPKVTGTPKVGKVLTAKKGTYTPATAKATYVWLRNGKAIKGATKTTYKLTAKDRGKRISVRITYKYPGARTVTKTVKVRKPIA